MIYLLNRSVFDSNKYYYLKRSGCCVHMDIKTSYLIIMVSEQ